ncbi:MAG: carbamate kinase [Anaerolineae bacterium]|nr:carbamate kinase [Anaerolineae bacterium]
MSRTALVAVGGNSLVISNDRADVPNQWEAVRLTVNHLADMIERGWELIVTHGNGPQVGNNLRRMELSAHELYTLPLDLIVAHTQGSIGYMLQQALANELRRRGLRKNVVTVVTQVLVDADDPAFAHPSKPIGSFLTEEKARMFEQEGWQVVEDAGRGWRRVVASPQPLRIMEEPAIRDLINAGHVVIAVGGGGIPVIQNMAGELRELKGVYAVIDKDRASSLLATRLNVDLFLISTGVEQVAVHFNTPQQQNLARMTVRQAQTFMAEGHFAKGSMLPKIESVLAFVQQTGHRALITNPENIRRALDGQTGTWVE